MGAIYFSGFQNKKPIYTQPNWTSSVWTGFWLGTGQIFQKSQLLVRLNFLTQTEPNHEYPYVTMSKEFRKVTSTGHQASGK